MSVEKAYELAKERYAAFGIDTDQMIERALELPISLHCWQADDVVGFETKPDGLAGGGIMATGNYPGRARDGKEARADIAKAMSTRKTESWCPKAWKDACRLKARSATLCISWSEGYVPGWVIAARLRLMTCARTLSSSRFRQRV